MWEHSWCKAASWDMDGFVATLNERAGEGWDVVSVIHGAPSGGDVTAILRRAASAAQLAATNAAPAVTATTTTSEIAEVTPDEEPAGWAAAPETAVAAAAGAAAATAEPAPIGAVDFEPITTDHPAAAAAATSTTPAGWYPDPSGRFEMRYWDGGQWSEHVARGGQQFTDPPVA